MLIPLTGRRMLPETGHKIANFIGFVLDAPPQHITRPQVRSSVSIVCFGENGYVLVVKIVHGFAAPFHQHLCLPQFLGALLSSGGNLVIRSFGGAMDTPVSVSDGHTLARIEPISGATRPVTVPAFASPTHLLAIVTVSPFLAPDPGCGTVK